LFLEVVLTIVLAWVLKLICKTVTFGACSFGSYKLCILELASCSLKGMSRFGEEEAVRG
jgi:hypothetical protein